MYTFYNFSTFYPYAFHLHSIRIGIYLCVYILRYA